MDKQRALKATELGQEDELMALAADAATQSYSPYSRFRVGAAVLVRDGRTFLGTNVENAAYGSSICAERVAICSAITAGAKDILQVAVFASPGATPCGACRQFIAEFGEHILVHWIEHGHMVSESIKTLLPNAFVKESLR